ncbi:MAG: hypothetical protein PHO70_06870 [Candidatus Omnitrophica bacterium]|nr:hypothetical protein [Candidatus Omnitrophota bacterium]
MPWWLNIFWDVVKFLLEKISYFKPPEDRPEVILDRIEGDRVKDENYFVAKNIGSRAALNIEISTLNLITKMPFNLSEDIFNLRFESTKIANLDSKQEKRIDYNVYIVEKNGNKVLSDSGKKLYFMPMFNQKYAQTDIHLLFEYNDSSGRRYVTHFSIGKNGIDTKGVYLIRKPELINKMFKRYGIVYKENNK